MYKGKKILAVIPARGGSKGIPRKNIKELGGKPLIAWTIECAKKSAYIDRAIISTEDEEIAEVARKWGGDVPFMRPIELAQDDTPGVMPVIHAVDALPGYDYVVLLQVTSPFRTAEDIDGTIKKCLDADADTCVSVTEAESSPYWMYRLGTDDRLNPLLDADMGKNYQRQKLPMVYQLNGAVYVVKRDVLVQKKKFVDQNTIGYLMNKNHSLDIDNIQDFMLAEIVIKNKRFHN